MLNVRLSGDHLYRKMLFTLMSTVIFLMMSFCAVFLLGGLGLNLISC